MHYGKTSGSMHFETKPEAEKGARRAIGKCRRGHGSKRSGYSKSLSRQLWSTMTTQSMTGVRTRREVQCVVRILKEC